MVIFGPFQFLPTGLHGLCFGFCFAGPLLRVRFRESLVIRLYSEIEHLHLSSEAQCVSHHLTPVDCHMNALTWVWQTITHGENL